MAGDWNSDGTDTIGVFRPSTGQFLLRNSNSEGWADLAFVFGGLPGDLPVAGNWDGQPATLPPTPTPSPTPVTPPALNASFSYDGDGKRVKSTLNGTTTYFVGAHYEVANGVVTKYYYAGAQRVAMRTNGTLNYLIGDHLGSTSLTTNASGQVISEMRYKAWGEVRYASGNTPTKYQYTGQFSNVDDFGLMFYGARWYDPYLTQFSQPDSIVPNPYNPQDWNRYSYARNNPTRYTDPSGHSVDCGIGDPWCAAGKFNFRLPKPSNKCISDCYDAYLTYEAVAYQLGRPPSLKEVVYMTADTEYTLWADSHGVRAFGQEGLARNFYEEDGGCGKDGICQGDELYSFLSGYQPWSDWKGTENNKKTPAQRADLLVGTLDGDKSWLWDDVTQILDINYATKQRWTDGKWTGEPWQWYGPFKPSKTCTQNVTPYINIRNQKNGPQFWMLFAEEDAIFSGYCP